MNDPLILIAEDSPEILMVLIDVLEMEGYRVHTCSDGQCALDYFTHCNRCPDMLITDIMMPRLNGLDLVDALRASDKFKDIPIAVYSASGQYAKVVREKGCSFLLKPFDLDQILGVIREKLPKGTT